MSSSDRHRLSKRVKAACAACQERKARLARATGQAGGPLLPSLEHPEPRRSRVSGPRGFKYRGEVRADRDHPLCFECYRAELNRARARKLGDGPPQRLLPFGPPDVVRVPLTGRQVAHRQLMLDHLRRRTPVAS